MSEITIDVNGVEYSNFTSAGVTLRLDAIAGDFFFSTVITGENFLPIKVNDLCEISVDGTRVLTGYVEVVNVAYTADTHSIDISGRSKTSDIIDSDINSLELKPEITLKEIIEKIISHIESDVKVINEAGDVEPFKTAEDLISPEIGENAFEFIEKIARKRQILLSSDGNGNIVLTRSGKDTPPDTLRNQIKSNDNNIKSASISYDMTERFSRYVVKSQLNLTALNFGGKTKSADIVDQKSEAVTDDEMIKLRKGRQLVIQAESSSSNGETTNRAEWEAKIRKARSITYSVEVKGFGVNGKLWGVNQLVKIHDDFARVHSDMLINEISYYQDGNSASTNISFVAENAYKEKLNEPEKGSKTGEGILPKFT